MKVHSFIGHANDQHIICLRNKANKLLQVKNIESLISLANLYQQIENTSNLVILVVLNTTY